MPQNNHYAWLMDSCNKAELKPKCSLITTEWTPLFLFIKSFTNIETTDSSINIYVDNHIFTDLYGRIYNVMWQRETLFGTTNSYEINLINSIIQSP